MQTLYIIDYAIVTEMEIFHSVISQFSGKQLGYSYVIKHLMPANDVFVVCPLGVVNLSVAGRLDILNQWLQSFINPLISFILTYIMLSACMIGVLSFLHDSSK